MSQVERETDDPDVESEAADSGASLIGSLAGGAWKLASEGPRLAMGLAQRGLTEAERMALLHLRRRMQEVAEDDTEARPARRCEPRPAAGSSTDGGPAPDPRLAEDLMAQLLEDAQEQTREDAQRYLAQRIVRQLVPDEARIVAGLSDGREAALIHLAATRLGRPTQRWLENVSQVGRESGVQLLSQVPTYVGHLRQLGLVEIGAEDPELLIKYQLLEADTKVRAAIKEIEAQGQRPRFFRGTLRLSEEGRAFWTACNPTAGTDG